MTSKAIKIGCLFIIFLSPPNRPSPLCHSEKNRAEKSSAFQPGLLS